MMKYSAIIIALAGVVRGDTGEWEKGFCTVHGKDQNSGVVKLNAKLTMDLPEDQADCIESCKSYPGATGCEVIWDQDNHGCYVHTGKITEANGKDRHLCALFHGRAEVWKRTANSQCAVSEVAYPQENVNNPIFGGGGFIGTMTRDMCQQECLVRRDSHGRRCVAIEFHTHSTDPDEKARCALAWGCEFTRPWDGGDVYTVFQMPAKKLGETEAKNWPHVEFSQCLVNEKDFDDDRLDNPLFGGEGFIGSMTRGQCQDMCMQRKDSRGRPCVAIEFDSHSTDPATIANCALAWGCDSTKFWDGGDVYMMPGETTFKKAESHSEGKASDCPSLGCETLSGGLDACMTKCANKAECNLINFCPPGADCTSGENRCCMRHCDSMADLQLTDQWKGWDVYTADNLPLQEEENSPGVAPAPAIPAWSQMSAGGFCLDTDLLGNLRATHCTGKDKQMFSLVNDAIVTKNQEGQNMCLTDLSIVLRFTECAGKPSQRFRMEADGMIRVGTTMKGLLFGEKCLAVNHGTVKVEKCEDFPTLWDFPAAEITETTDLVKKFRNLPADSVIDIVQNPEEFEARLNDQLRDKYPSLYRVFDVLNFLNELKTEVDDDA